MERERGTVIERLARVLDLPPEVVFNFPKTTLIGNVQVLVENHQGLLAYDPHTMRVRTAQGELVISGSGLQIGSILPRELVVDGRILHVELRR